MTTPIPDWMLPIELIPDCPGNREALIALERQSYEIAFETALEAIADGTTLQYFCAHYHQPLSPTRFRTWIFKDARRKAAYEVAKALSAEAMEEDLVRIADGLRADGTQSMDDVQRSTLMVNTRKWLMQANNRQRYGDVKKVEQTTTSTTTIDVTTMSTDDLKKFVLRQAGIDADVIDAVTLDELMGGTS